MYAIIQKGSHQYKVTPGMELALFKLSNKEGDNVTIKEVLMVVDDRGEIKVGQPYVSKAWVELHVKGEKKGEKIDVMRFKAKSRYTKRKGFRDALTLVSVNSININSIAYKDTKTASSKNEKATKTNSKSETKKTKVNKTNG